MTKAKSTKKALLLSAVSLFLCFAMLLGTTFAWFTDSVTSANNIIKSGNLDIELEYWKGDAWVDVAGKSDVLTNLLWEPGVTEVAYLRVANAGSLALKYQLGINIVSETAGVNAAGEPFKLSDYIKFGVKAITATGEAKVPSVYATREAAVAAVEAIPAGQLGAVDKISAGYGKADAMAAGEEFYLALVVYMPTDVGNVANHNGVNVPEIQLGINVMATQMTSEEDSFGSGYDADAAFVLAPVARPENATKDMNLKGANDVIISLPAEVINALPEDVEEIGMAVSDPVINATAKTLTFASVELVDQNGNEIDLDALDLGENITVTLPLPEEAPFEANETVMVYHDGEFVANAVVGQDGKISYAVAHLCEVTIGTYEAPVEENNTVVIKNVAQFFGFAQSVNEGNTYEGKTVLLACDIDLNNVAWTPIGCFVSASSVDFSHAFKGNFDGQENTISNLNVNNSGWAGVFGIVYKGTIKNLNVKGATINSNRMAGAIVGQIYGSIDNCHVEDVTITMLPNSTSSGYDNGDKVGGIVGWLGDNGNKNHILDCTANNVTIKAYRDMGGITGYIGTTTTVERCEANNITLTVDQDTNSYGAKTANAGAIVGRIYNTPVTIQNNKESNITILTAVSTATGFANAMAKGGNVILAGNIDMGTVKATVPAGVNVVLDLNGYAVQQASVETTANALITNKGTLTINDTVGTGKVSYQDITAYTKDNGFASNTIRNEGLLTVNGGTIENITSAEVMNYSYPHAIDAYQGSVTNITGGTVKSLNYDAIRMFCNSETLATTVNISGGTIVNRISFQDPATNRAGYGVLNITGGTFVTTDGVGANVRLLNFSKVTGNMKATISGGTFDKGIVTQDLAGTGVTNEDWVTYAVAVANAEELSQAIADGAKVIFLTADIVADFGIALANGVTLNGNGYSLTYAIEDDYHLVSMGTDTKLENIKLYNYRVRTENTTAGNVTITNVEIWMDNDLTGLDISRGSGTAILTGVVCKGIKDEAHLNPETQVQVDYTPYGDVLLGGAWALNATDCDFGSLHGWNTRNGSNVYLNNTTYTVFRMHYWSGRTLYVDGVETAWSESGAIPVAHDVGGCWSVQPAFK